MLLKRASHQEIYLFTYGMQKQTQINVLAIYHDQCHCFPFHTLQSHYFCYLVFQALSIAIKPIVSTRLFALKMTITSVKNCLGDTSIHVTQKGGDPYFFLAHLSPTCSLKGGF